MGVTHQIAEYVVSALGTPLPERTVEAVKHHVLDTIAAIVSGSRLPAGQAGATYVRDHADDGVAVVCGQSDSASPAYAALANAMAAHADESDDSHELSKSHPGCSIVPTALATAHAVGGSGTDLLRSVALGYDIGTRVNMALWPSFTEVRNQPRGTPGICGMFGSATSAAALRRLDTRRVQYLMSYVAQQVSGMNTWKRDVEHIEKAYVLGGWPAFAAQFALSVVEHGWSGVQEVFDGDPSFLDIVGNIPDRSRLTDQLGSRFEVERTHIKLHAVGSPAQAPVQGLLEILRDEALSDPDVAAVEVTLPSVLAATVQRSRVMANINLEYLLSVVVADEDLSFEATHDERRFHDWRVGGRDPRITIVHDPDMEPRRQAIVEVTTVTGHRYRRRIATVHGSPECPMSSSDVRAKAVALISPVMGEAGAAGIADAVLSLDRAGDLTELTTRLRQYASA